MIFSTLNGNKWLKFRSVIYNCSTITRKSRREQTLPIIFLKWDLCTFVSMISFSFTIALFLIVQNFFFFCHERYPGTTRNVPVTSHSRKHFARQGKTWDLKLFSFRETIQKIYSLTGHFSPHKKKTKLESAMRSPISRSPDTMPWFLEGQGALNCRHKIKIFQSPVKNLKRMRPYLPWPVFFFSFRGR